MASCLRWLTFWSHSKHQSNSEDLNWAQLSCYLSLHHLLLNIKVITMQYDYCQGNASEANTKGYLSASLNRVLYPRYWRPFISLNTAGFQGFYGLNEEIQLPHWRWTNMCGLGWCRVVILFKRFPLSILLLCNFHQKRTTFCFISTQNMKKCPSLSTASSQG